MSKTPQFTVVSETLQPGLAVAIVNRKIKVINKVVKNGRKW